MKKTIIKSEFCGTYEVREEHHSDLDITMETAYTFDNHYIGDRKTAEFLCLDKGVAPELIDPTKNVCSIGFCRDRNTWAGWSHRSYREFGIDSKVKKGDCAYQSTNKEDFMEDCIHFWKDDHDDISAEFTEKGVQVSWTYSDTIPNETLRGTTGGTFCDFPSTWGKGEWSAKTLREAKQMAIDFSESVA